jgi:Aldose 1-epimerase
VTELGAGLRELLFGDRPVIAGYGPDELPPGGAGQLLAPWPNRIDGGRYTFGGAELQLALTEPAYGNAIHGLTRWMAWTPVWHGASAVLLRSALHGQGDIRSACKSTPSTGSIRPAGCTSPSLRATAAAARLPTAPARTRT